jgi:hypothetical protein
MTPTVRALALLSVVALGACTPPAAGVCKRADECNVLAAGVSVEQCIENSNQYLDSLTASVRADCEKDLADALANASCEAFLVDYNAACQVGTGPVDTF